MINLSLRFAAVLLACLALAPTAGATGQSRAEYRNLSSSQTATQQQNPGVASYGGYIKGSQTQTANTVVLQDCAFGQAFSQWYPSATYGSTIAGVDGISGVRGALYPIATPGTARAAIEASGKPFRYKWLLYTGTGTDVTAFDPTSVAGWFTQPDRDAIYAQIAILKDAIAASPLDTSLRNLLLDIYFDLAVAEMQATKPKLAELAKYHLGILLPGPAEFVIDKEIDTYVAIDAAFLAAIAQYRELLNTAFPDIDPSSFDDRVPFGMPMGQYIFRREQPSRASYPSRYANASGVQEVPQSVNGSIVTPGTLFTGYKDLKALLDINGQRQQYLADLARLRGARQEPGDLALARQSVADATGPNDTDLQVIKSWFPVLFPPDLNALSQPQKDAVTLLQQNTGVLASLSTLETGRIDLMSVVPFLNGSANILGYDPEFLLLVQSTANPPLESYDTFRAKLTENANAPHTYALAALTTAKADYNSFLEKVDRTAQDLDDAQTAYADRYVAITGFTVDESPPFNPLVPNPKEGSELDGVLKTIAALDAQAALRTTLTAAYDDELADGTNGGKLGEARAAVSSALKKEQTVTEAAATYKATTRSLYEESISWKAEAAASQATFEAVSAAASIAASASGANPAGIIGGSVAAGVTAAVGAANADTQRYAAQGIGKAEQNIDYAGIDLTTTIGNAEAALTVNQARQNLSALKRAQISNNMAATADLSARGQAEAQRNGLLLELARISRKRDSNVADIQKKSYADPIHYHRAERALLDADETFRDAQRAIFYTLQALNYKWNGKFAATAGSKSYDSSSVFRARNATELDALLTRMQAWNQTRVDQTITSARIITRISLRDHILARNPNRHNVAPLSTADPGTRADDTASPPPAPLPSLPTLQYFRQVLKTSKYMKGNGDLSIPFSTLFGSQLVDAVDGNFFLGARYDADGNCTFAGYWRERIEYVKVNIVRDGGPTPPPSLSGTLYYGGATYFRTRVPPRGDRTYMPVANPDTGIYDDHAGELMVTPFRYWVSPNFTQNFVPKSEHDVPANIGYGAAAVVTKIGDDFFDDLIVTPILGYVGRSIAASDWKLEIPRSNVSGFTVDVNNIADIEIVIAYKHSDRVLPPP